MALILYIAVGIIVLMFIALSFVGLQSEP